MVRPTTDIFTTPIGSCYAVVDSPAAFARELREECGRNLSLIQGIINFTAEPSSYPVMPNGLAGARSSSGGLFAPSVNVVVGLLQLLVSGVQDGASADASKQAKTPQAAQASGSTPVAHASTPASTPTPGGPTMPSTANVRLKRKAPSGRAGEDSPIMANADVQPTAKIKHGARHKGRRTPRCAVANRTVGGLPLHCRLLWLSP